MILSFLNLDSDCKLVSQTCSCLQLKSRAEQINSLICSFEFYSFRVKTTSSKLLVQDYYSYKSSICHCCVNLKNKHLWGK